jgi:hypothetical protein
MDNFIKLKKVLNEKFHGRILVGGPRLKREDNIGRNSSLLLNVRGWRRLAQGRNIWRRTVEEATA